MIISTDSELRQYIPNVLVTVEGEKTLYEKIEQHLRAAEEWVKDSFTGEDVYSAIENLTASERLRVIVANIVAAEAFKNAIPSLDLILTPNGFGIVSNNNVLPASKERVDRLMTQTEDQRDLYAGLLIRRLPAQKGWLTTEQAAFFGATLFPSMSLCDRMDIRSQRWTKYLKLRENLLHIEKTLAAKYFSEEQMTVFRQIVLSHSGGDTLTQQVIMKIQSIELMILREQPVHNQDFFDIVNVIRNNEDTFPEWQGSDTAELYQIKPFENKKESGGYWF